MHALTTSAISAAVVNGTKSEIRAITFPREFDTVPWGDLDFFGWRDPRMEQRGYLVLERDDALLTLLLTTGKAAGPGGRKAMCSVCRAVDNGANIALFAARRVGPAGRRGDTVGTYVCTGLDCSAQLRFPTRRARRSIIADVHDGVDERAAAMMLRLTGFVDAVMG